MASNYNGTALYMRLVLLTTFKSLKNKWLLVAFVEGQKKLMSAEDSRNNPFFTKIVDMESTISAFGQEFYAYKQKK